MPILQHKGEQERVELPDYLPLSFINQYVYCPRRFWLMYVQNEMEINAPVLEGVIRHQRAHQAGEQKDEHGRTLRSVQLWSDALRIKGVADFIEEHQNMLIPVEHKRGRMGRWLNDHMQLCAQALCLEERNGQSISYGEIFYWENRRREVVQFNETLRAQTIQVIQAIFDLLKNGQMPAPIDQAAKCHDCSLEPICLPRETLRLLEEQ
jgi:CRISPR-associated exonuclease Cas4